MRYALSLTLVALFMGSASGGELAVISMHHSADHFVPHLRFDGVIEPGDADDIADILKNISRCTTSCDGASAVLSLDSPGGSYIEALEIADILRREHVATLIEADSKCASACLAAFTGGTRKIGDGDVPDRVVVPGAQIGLTPFDKQDEGLAHAILDGGLEQVLGAPLDQLRTMVEDGSLGEIAQFSGFLVPTGSLYMHDLTTPSNLEMLGATLPSAPLAQLMPDKASALLQACAHALSRYYAAMDMILVPEDAEYNIDPAFQQSLGSIGNLGYRINDSYAQFCSGDYYAEGGGRVWLFGAGEEGTEEVFGTDIEPHMVFPVSEPTANLERFYAPFVNAWTFVERPFSTSMPEKSDPHLDADLGVKVLLETLVQRVSARDDFLFFEQAGIEMSKPLATYLSSPAIVDRESEGTGTVSVTRATHADTGNAVVIAAIVGSHDNWIGQIETGKPWSEMTSAEVEMITRWSCNFTDIAEHVSCD